MLYGILRGGFIMEEKILIEEEFNLILDEALKSVITDALWDNDTISDVTIGTDGFTVTFFEN